jgi:comEA protein
MTCQRFGDGGSIRQEDFMQRRFSFRDAIFKTCLTLVVVALAAVLPGTALGKSPSAAEAAVNTSAIDINVATAEQLTALPGIGSVMAERIVKFREQHGDFKRVEDLLKVKGIGEKSFQKIRPGIKISKTKSH